ncbi:MAG TPA: AMP-binding protein [Actinomycetota bacterium]|jgi:acetyl-CoA synthetase|nr:AMP-binding protein [Actinomycetota bacterium]
MTQTPTVWRPSHDYLERANVTRFMRAHGIETYEDLIRRSREDIEWFWAAVVEDLGIEFFTPWERVLDTSDGIPWAKWFVGGTTNLAHNCVDKWAERTPDAVAVIWEGEDGAVRRVTYVELREMADRLAAGLRSLGVGRGDAVGIFLPMAPETVAATLATAKLGAVYLPIFSGYAPDAVAARLADADAKVLLTADGFLRRGQAVRMKEVADAAADQVSSVKHVVTWRRLGRGDVPSGERDVDWEELCAGQPGRFETVPLDTEHPLFVAYTSGTTGRPKGSVHVHGGFTVKIAEEVAYQTDLHRGEILFWVTDLGWIMGPWEIVGAGALGAAVFLYEGAPNHPEPDRIWSIVERHGITTLGVSPTLIRALIPAGDEWVEKHDLSSLRIIGSTGEPWNPEPYLWLFEKVGGGRCPIINISGGTEVGACFLSPLPITDLKPCTLRGPALGMAVEVWGPDGTPVPRGEVGELVCTKPWPAMTRGIWRDPDRYLETYWSRFPDVWVHGDWASIDEDGFWFLHGRSDDTIKVAGKRVGPAEVESALVDHPAVAESAAVGVPHEVKGETIWCFVVTKPGSATDDTLGAELKQVVAAHLGKAFTPARIVFVDELPRTRSAKILRRAIRATVAGEDPGDLSSLENPIAIEKIRAAVD